MNKKYFLIFSIMSVLAIGACKKSKVDPVTTPPVVTPPTTGTATRQQLSLDSIFLYAKEIYYWNDKLPTYDAFNPRQYSGLSTDKANYDKELLEITKYSDPYEWTTGATSPKYSYIFDKTNKNPTASINEVSSVDLEGNGNDLGIRFGLYGSTSDYIIYVTAVYQNSPAEKSGFVRGDVIKKINGVSYGTDYNSEVGALNTALSGTTVTLDGIKAGGTTFNLTLTKAVFKSSPIYKSKVITAGTKKVGYVAYARFSNADNSVNELNTIFDGFATSGVTDLVVDLRYNGGGYVSTAEHLINLIAPSTASGVMFSEYYNATMQAGNAKILANQPLLDANGNIRYSNGTMLTYANVNYSIASNTVNFAKKGALANVTNIVFIVSGNTASASELVINSLKPKMNVKLVGKTTYGKPIGFFPVTIENRYDVYFSLFETKNSLGQGGYYSGMVPDYDLFEVPSGTIMYDFGNVNDVYLKKALDVLAPGTTVTNDKTVMAAKQTSSNTVSSSNMINADFVDREFKGMIENRFKLKN
jgi:carboxyl-terminal processing protease